MNATDFLVQRSDLRQTQLVASAVREPAPGQVLLRVEKFAFTANNVTYAVFGDAMQYWNFFPAPDGQAGWGRIPVWGFGEVIASRHDALPMGERVYGYLPMSSHVLLAPERVTPASFTDGAAHRRALPAAYQLYRRVPAKPDTAQEDRRALLHPLFMTSFLIEDFLSDNALFGARRVLLASASSKTALGVAFLLARSRPQGCEVVGLTSPGNRAFCESLGHYDRVVPYAELATLPADVPTAFVDMAGDGTLLRAVHHHFGEALRHSCIVGATHWEQRATQHALPGAKPQFFFAPTQIKKRFQDWGADGFERRFDAAWQAFLPSVERWLTVEHGHGGAAVERAYRDVLEGRVLPQAGHILSLS